MSTYDIIVTRRTEGKYIDPRDKKEKPSVKYDVMGVPPKPLKPEIKAALESTQIRLEALYEGKDPWKDLESSASFSFDSVASESLSEEQSANIDMALREFGEKESEMRKFICARAEVKSVYFIPPEKYQSVMTYLKEQIKKGQVANERRTA